MPHKIIVVVFFCFLIGCSANIKQLSRAEMINSATREYTDVKKEQIFEAIEKIFKLSEPNNVAFLYDTDNQVRVGMQNSLFPMYLRHDWLITVDDTHKKDVNTVKLQYEITVGGLFVPHAKSQGFSPDTYSLFFRRLDYFLGKTQKWYSCELYEKENPDTTTLAPLCGFAKDNSP